jgi:hypothetical protein
VCVVLVGGWRSREEQLPSQAVRAPILCVAQAINPAVLPLCICYDTAI